MSNKFNNLSKKSKVIDFINQEDIGCDDLSYSFRKWIQIKKP
jgi:hypothetical protein